MQPWPDNGFVSVVSFKLHSLWTRDLHSAESVGMEHLYLAFADTP